MLPFHPHTTTFTSGKLNRFCTFSPDQAGWREMLLLNLTNMKAIITVVLTALLAPTPDFAQTQINKSIPVSAGQSVLLHFDYPELVRVSTWDKNEVSVQG